MMRTLLTTLLGVFLTMAPFRSEAQPPLPAKAGPRLHQPPSARDNIFSVMVVGGAGTPVGYGGVEVGVDLSPNVQIALGSGWAEGGPHVAITTRLRFWTKGSIFTFLGVGVSYGEAPEPPTGDAHPNDERFAVEHGFYGNGELGVGWRLASGVQVMWAVGFATLLNLSEATCIENCTIINSDGTTSYTGESHDIPRVLSYIALHIGMTF